MSAPLSPLLFSPLKVGAFELAHRVVMPALALGRMELAGRPFATALTRHFVSRATPGGLLVTQANWVDRAGRVDDVEPGLCSPDQVNDWRHVTDAVRETGAVIVAQLGFAEAEACTDGFSMASTLDVDTAMRQARDAAEGASDAGFDGIELLGTLPEQFFHDPTIVRADEYPDGKADRIGLLLDMLRTLCGVWPPERIGIRLTAITPSALRHDPQAMATLRAAVDAVVAMGAAYVHLALPWPAQPCVAPAWLMDSLRAVRREAPANHGVLIASGGFTPISARAALDLGLADAIGFGRAFLANADLAQRLRAGAPLAPSRSDLPPEPAACHGESSVKRRETQPPGDGPSNLAPR